jgi:hypothetical protein
VLNAGVNRCGDDVLVMAAHRLGDAVARNEHERSDTRQSRGQRPGSS